MFDAIIKIIIDLWSSALIVKYSHAKTTVIAIDCIVKYTVNKNKHELSVCVHWL